MESVHLVLKRYYTLVYIYFIEKEIEGKRHV